MSAPILSTSDQAPLADGESGISLDDSDPEMDVSGFFYFAMSENVRTFASTIEGGVDVRHPHQARDTASPRADTPRVGGRSLFFYFKISDYDN